MQTSRKILFVSLVLLFGLSACGKKLSPLTTTQREEFANTLVGVANPLNAAQVKSSKRSSNGFRPGPFSSDQNTFSDQVDYIPSELNDDFNNNCEANFETSGQGSVFMSAKAYVRDVSGLVCPIALDLSLSAELASQDRATLNLDLTYDVRHEEMKKLNDITGFEISGRGDIRGSDNSGTIEFNSNGKIQSQRNGDVGFYLNVNASGNQSNVKVEAKLGMEFTTYTAELKIVGEGAPESQNPDLKFYLNDQEITAEEFMAFFEKFKDPRQPDENNAEPILNPINPENPIPFAKQLSAFPVIKMALSR